MEFLTVSVEVFREGLSKPRDQIMRRRPWEGLGEKHSSQNQPQYKGPEGGEQKGLCTWTQWRKMRSEVGEEDTWG